MPLSEQRARQLIQELGGWFGPPLLCRVPLLQVITDGPDIIDGHSRWKAAGTYFEIPHVIFPKSYRGGIYSVDGRLLPRLLVLFGHPARAWQYVPDHWRDSPQALESFLNVERELALEVWAAGLEATKRGRPSRQIKGRRDHTHAEKVEACRTIVRAWSCGEAGGMPEIAEILGYRL